MTDPTALSDGERSVLLAVGPGCGTVRALADRLGLAHESVEAAVSALLHARLLEARDGLLVQTPEGSAAADRAGRGRSEPRPPVADERPPGPDLDDLARSVGAGVGAALSAWSAEQRRRDAAASADAQARLVSDAERDGAVHVLADAFSHGRLSADELEQRTGRALAARTHGELDAVLHGLGGLRLARPNHPGRKVVFWLLAVVTAPFLLVGGLLLAGGNELDDRLVGLVLVGVALPALLKVRRWAWPKPH